MFETVTVDDALKRGRRMINYPIIPILAVTVCLFIYLTSIHLLPDWAMGVGILSGFVVGWLYWSFMITRWRLWAFDNVRNVHELKRKAIEQKLIWKDGSFWERTEIRTQADKQRWQQLQQKFAIADHYEDDITVPAETVIYYAPVNIFFQIFLNVFLLGTAIYMFTVRNYFGAVFMAVLDGFVLFAAYKRAHNHDAQLILNANGIQTVKAGFNSWTNIQNEQVVTRTVGKNTHTYLEFNYTGGSEKLDIAGLAVTKKALENLLHTYRVRGDKRV